MIEVEIVPHILKQKEVLQKTTLIIKIVNSVLASLKH